MNLKILHISVHLGGGVGTVIKNWIEKDSNQHTILLLNENFHGKKEPYIHENFRGRYSDINRYIENNDIVIIHYWNHPMLFEFLVNSNLPKCRLCFWSHVSALYPPYVHSNKLVEYADKFILSSKISDISFINKNLYHKLDYIWTTGGIDSYLDLKHNKSNDKFIVGYIGTLDYSKLHRNFISMCKQIYQRIPNVHFTICGSGCDYDIIKKQSREANIDHVMEFTGIVDVKDYIPTFDVFGYPLNNKHFGTCEQVLGEVMANGIQPIVLDNPCEKYIVKYIGKVCKTEKQYVDSICNVFDNPISTSSKTKIIKRAKKLYDINKMIQSWNNEFELLMKLPKTNKSWNCENNDGYSIFLESIGEYKKIIEEQNFKDIKQLFDSNIQWKSKGKGSLYQYIDIFPNDDKLLKLSEFINKPEA